MNRFFLLVVLMAVIGCSKNGANLTPKDLQGQWIEIQAKTDTLTFNQIDNLGIMILDRGKEMRNNYLLPKPASGPYEFRLSKGKISLYWMLSSNYSFNDYNFKRSGNKLTIDNFYNAPLGSSLTFEKLN